MSDRRGGRGAVLKSGSPQPPFGEGGAVTKVPRPLGDAFMDQLERSITDTLKNKKTSARDRNAAIANGIKLAQIRHRINPESEEDYFGGEK